MTKTATPEMIEHIARALALDMYPDTRWPKDEEDADYGVADREGRHPVSWHFVQKCRSQARVALAASQAVEPVAVPDGWKLVPVEPTDAMIDAGDEINEAGAAWSGYAEIPASAEKHYRAMLAAAPTPPASTDLREENESQRGRAYQGMMDEVEALTGALHAAESRAATLSAENAVLRQHVEELQGKMKAVCACSYDNPGEVCDAHNPTVKALKERLETVEEAIKALVSLNDEYHPFGGETYQDRIERIWRRARAAIRKDKP